MNPDDCNYSKDGTDMLELHSVSHHAGKFVVNSERLQELLEIVPVVERHGSTLWKMGAAAVQCSKIYIIVIIITSKV